MRRPAVFLAAFLALPVAANAAVVPTLPLAAPPVQANATTNQIFDAMIAISRAAAVNPQAAQRASFAYAAAIQQYNAGDVDRARASAAQAIAQSNGPTPSAPVTNPMLAPVSGPYMPPVVDDIQAEMEERLALARRSLSSCGPTDGNAFATARSRYDTAVADMLHRKADALNADVQSIVDTCAAAVNGQSGPNLPAN
jgi:hypothetical protein